MSRYRYKFSMSYLDVKSSQETPIRVECIKSICVEHDYDNKNMPIMLMDLTLDKNLVDDIILNAKNNMFNIFSYRYSVAGDQYAERNFQGQFVYFLQEDINYNKDIDYSSTETEANGGIERNDQYRNITIGLMLKKNLDDNKHSVNDIVYNTTMINIVAAETANFEILIEPFTYNNVIEQLVIPPTETISKLLNHLNNVSVFYDTKYRFFMDYDTAYLLSSSGDPVKRQNEKYSSVVIDIRNITASDAFEEGMKEDNTQNCYVIPISTKDSSYVTNNVTDKDFNNIKAILDSSKKQADLKSSSVMNVITRFTNAAKTINRAVSSVTSKISNVGNELNRMKYELVDDAETALETSVTIKDVTVKLDNIFSRPGISVDNKNQALKDILEIYHEAEDISNRIQYLPDQYENIRDKVFENVCNAGSFGSYVNGVDYINYSDNIGGLNRLYKNVTEGGAQNKVSIEEIFDPVSTKYNDMEDRINRIIELIRGLPDQVMPEGSSSGGSEGGETAEPIDVSDAKELIPELEALKPPVRECAKRLEANTTLLKSYPDMCQSTATKCNVGIEEIINTPNVLKEEYTGSSAGSYTSVYSTASAAEKYNETKEKLATASIKGFSDFGQAQLDRLNNMGNSILKDIKNGIDAIGDLTNLGSTGVTEVEVKIDVNSDEYGQEKVKLIRVPNDNANLLKQMKSELELSAAKLIVNKNDLDSSVLTPNKEYTVRNYDTRSDKNGKFLLSNKKEIYLREDDTFILNTILIFRQIPNSTV